MEKVTLQVTFPKEKLEALRFYMNEKQLTVEEELQKHIKNTYDKYVPSAARRYLDRNDDSVEIETELATSANGNTSKTSARNTATRGRRRTGRSQTAEEQETSETTNGTEIEENSEQTEGQDQGMTMSM